MNLSKPQKRTLCDLFTESTNIPIKPFIVKRLIEKGLVVVTKEEGEFFNHYCLTEAGQKVLDSIRLSTRLI